MSVYVNELPRRIVAEVSKNSRDVACTISDRFETVISVNRSRGYDLESWRLTSTYVNCQRVLVETIVAVFVKRDHD